MLAKIRSVLAATWSTLAFVGVVVGILYLWPDLKGLPAAYGYSWKWPMWLEREAIAYGALAVSLAWIFWIDVRPLVREWARKPMEIVYANEINDPTKYGPNKINKLLLPPSDVKGGKLHEETLFRIGIKNNIKNETLKNVNIVLHTIDKPTSFCDVKLPVADAPNEFSVDIPPLRVIYFDLCKTVRPNVTGGGQMEWMDPLSYHLLNGASGPFGATIPGKTGQSIGLLKNDGYTAVIGVYADDKPAIFVEFTINAKDSLTVYFNRLVRGLYEQS